MSTVPVFRVAVRREGGLINVYLAACDSMEGALFVASMSAALADLRPETFVAFKQFAAGVARSLAGEAVPGAAPTIVEEPAPEHERAGHA